MADVKHDHDGRRFVVKTDGGEAELSYRQADAGTLELDHTFVPEAARGQKLGDRLAEAAFAHARREKLKLIVTCPFVQAWLKRNESQRDIVVG